MDTSIGAVGAGSAGNVAALSASVAVQSALDANASAGAAALFGSLGLGTATDSFA